MAIPVNNDGSNAAPAPAAPAREPASAPAVQQDDQSGGYTAATWAAALLDRLGYPTTQANLTAITSWEAAEGGHWNNTAYFNPLNTTQSAPGATSMNSVGVKAYTSWDQGLDATVKTLKNGYYGSILNALKAGNSATAVADAVTSSPWGTKQISVGDHTSYGTSTVDTSTRIVTAAPATDPRLGQPAQLSVGQYLDNPALADSYGYLAAFMHDKEIGPILAKAAQGGWGSAQLLGALSKTTWWQRYDATARKWAAVRAVDPASWRSAINRTGASLLSEAKALGVAGALPWKRVVLMAATALNTGYADENGHLDSTWARGALAADFHYTAGGTYGGEAGRTLADLNARAGEYLVHLSNPTLENWTRQVLAGTATTDDFIGYLQAQAKSLFPTLSEQIDKGISPTQALNPYAELAAKTLEITPGQVDFTQPKWRALIDQVDPKTGQRAPLSLADTQRKLMLDPTYGYDQTGQAKEQASGLATQIGQMFGQIGA